MNCKRAQRTLQGYLDGTSGPGERGLLESHIGSCESCRAELEGQRRLLQLLGDMPARRTSEQFEARLSDAVRRAPAASPLAAWWQRVRLHLDWRLSYPRVAAITTVAAALAAVSVMPSLVPPRDSASGELPATVNVAVQRHRQLEHADSRLDWDAVDSSIAVSTGALVTE